MASSLEILKKEFQQLQNDPIVALGINVGLINEDYYHWKCIMMGPKGTPYEGGFFTLTIDFPSDFPKRRPEVKFKNKMYHLNVNTDGHVCINTLNDWEKHIKKPSISQVLSNIFALFHMQNPNSAYGDVNLYRNNRAQFDRNAKEWTKKYAGPDSVE